MTSKVQTQGTKAQNSKQRRPKPASPVTQTAAPSSQSLQRALADPGAASAADILALQQMAGNRAVQRLLARKDQATGGPKTTSPIQTKLTVGPVGDVYEQEADRVAQQVVNQINQPAAQPADTSQAVQRAMPDEEELQLKPLSASITPLVQRMAGAEGGPVTQEVEAALQQARGSGQPLADSIRAPLEQAFGADFSGVNVHTDAQADTLNRSLQARAFTSGQDVFFREGEYNPQSHSGQELIAHELTHVTQQQPTLARKSRSADATAVSRAADSGVQRVEVQEQAPAGIQRDYAALGSMAKARVDQQSEEKYSEKAQEFEFKMAPKIMGNDSVNTVVDGLVARVRQIVDAWAAATGKKKDETYEREFGWQGGDEYYGAFEMTAANIKQIFGDKSQPMRAKLKLVYNAVRNNNLSKWLKLAAIELQRKTEGKKARDWKIKTATQNVTQNDKIVRGRAVKELVKTGFAKQSGLESWLTSGQVKSFAETAEKEKKTEHKRSKRDVFGFDRFSGVMGWKSETAKANKERRGFASGGLSLGEQRTLTVNDIPDLTDAEVDMLLKRQGNLKPSKTDRANFRKDPNAKIMWSQGGEFYDIQLGSDSARTAGEVKARMEAGISGSTDLMLHAIQNLGLSDETNMKGMRLALAGWMLANRDHSFYEVYKAAESYGVPFDIDKSDPGKEYESANNLSPMKPEDFADTLPEKKFPRYYLSTAHKDTLADKLPEATKDQDTFKGALQAQGLPLTTLNTLDARATAELSRLSELIAGATIDTGERMAKKQQVVRRIKQSSAYTYLGNTLGETEVEKILSALLKTHHGVKGLAPDAGDKLGTLVDAGIPHVILDFLSTPALNDVELVRQAIMRATINPKTGGLAWNPPTDALQRLSSVHKLSPFDLQRIQNVLIQTYHGNAQLAPDNKNMADATRRLVQIESIARLHTTSGWWYSWGNLGYLQGAVNAGSIRAYTASMSFEQGPGFYIANTANSSSTYGGGSGQGIIAVKLNNAPTISRTNKAQVQLLKQLAGGGGSGDPLKDAGLYAAQNVVEMLMIYNGSGSWGRLTTNRGVEEMTLDLKRPPLTDLKKAYPKMVEGAKANFKTQAAKSGLDTSWMT